MPVSPVSTQQGVGQAFGGGQESLARRKAAAGLIATNAQEKSEGLGSLIAGVAPTILSLAGKAVGTAVGGPAGTAVGGAIGEGLGSVIQSMDTSDAERQQAEQEVENIQAQQEGRAPRQIQAKKSQTKAAGSAIGGLVGKLSGKEGEALGSLGDILSIGGM